MKLQKYRHLWGPPLTGLMIAGIAIWVFVSTIGFLSHLEGAFAPDGNGASWFTVLLGISAISIPVVIVMLIQATRKIERTSGRGDVWLILPMIILGGPIVSLSICEVGLVPPLIIVYLLGWQSSLPWLAEVRSISGSGSNPLASLMNQPEIAFLFAGMIMATYFTIGLTWAIIRALRHQQKN